MQGAHWLSVFAMILLAWAAVYAMSVPAEMRAAGRIYGADFWTALCNVTPDAAGYARLVVMWAAMSAAMMVPTFLPAMATYEDLTRTGATNPSGVWQLLAGYLAVWLGFSVLAAAVQMGLAASGLVDPLGGSLSRGFTAALLAGAGLYQFSTLKAACLSKCRAPLTFFMQHWRPERWNAVQMGLRLGVVCLGCCWALMALAFVGGTMNLIWMGLATVLMTFEKLPAIGDRLTRPLAIALLGAAGLTLTGLI